MKKFLIILFLVIIAAGAVFYIGWLQFRVERNEIGVVHTKTVGYLSSPVIPGEFYWTPWRLIPRNVTLIKIPAHPVTLTISQTGSLPSGQLYSYYIQGHPDFSFSLGMSITFSINPNSAVALTASENLSEDTYQEWINVKRDAIKQRALTLIMNRVSDIASSISQGQPGDLQIDAGTLRSDIAANFPELTILSMTIDSLELPDLSLYIQARESYYRALATQQKTLEDALEEFSADRAELELYVQKLEKYGRLFTQYPALLEYLELHPLESLP